MPRDCDAAAREIQSYDKCKIDKCLLYWYCTRNDGFKDNFDKLRI